jgi:CRISPR-associated protein Cas1
MPHQTVYISGRKYLGYKNRCLEITDKDTGVFAAIPMAEIGLVIVDSAMVTISGYAMGELGGAGVGVVFCDGSHSPISISQPLYSASVPFKKVKLQTELKKPPKKQLWKIIVKAKIGNQIAVLEKHGAENRKISQLKAMLGGIKSGDSTKKEGAASGVYFKALFGSDFRRNREGGFPNNIMNFSYMVMRAYISRSIIAAGLSPMLGIHHKNNYNPMTLSDDLIEPYRPIIDSYIIENIAELAKDKDLRRDNKAILLKMLYSDVMFDDKTHTVQTSVTRYIESYAKAIELGSENLRTPELC